MNFPLSSYYSYDDLRRQTATQRLNTTTTNILDAADRALATIRIATNGSWNTLQQTAYDVAGRVTTQTNALNGVTALTNIFDASGQTVKTNTYPNGGTSIGTYAQD